ncbi:MAG: hypothetical protein KY457_00100 [Actinobacteria bacterium]|nr:hypothetical protein [Actinomycetota bacterium]
MVRPRYKPVTPDQRIRELRKDFRSLQKEEESGPGLADRLASFTREAHLERQLNMAMHTATRYFEEDPEAPELLVQAYLEPVDGPEDRLRAFVDLRDLARYVDRPELAERCDAAIASEAREWVRGADEAERRHRLRTLTSMLSREFADQLRDELRFL